MVDDIGDLARFYEALGDETRLRLVELLTQQERGRAMCVGRLAQELGVTPSAVSQHLRILKDLGMVQGQRMGHRIHYFLDLERLAAYQTVAQKRLGAEFALAEASSNMIGGDTMCDCSSKSKCAHPERLQGDPRECTPEQIRECHGEGAEHACECSEQEES
jgi:ArsR family transcriptional regulator